MMPVEEMIVPDFEAKIEESPLPGVNWLQQNLNLSDEYVANLINLEENHFAEWKQGRRCLAVSQLEDLKTFSSVMTRLLSFLNFRPALVSKMLTFQIQEQGQPQTPLTPPWLGMSPKEYMKDHGINGIKELDLWIQKMRWADWS